MSDFIINMIAEIADAFISFLADNVINKISRRL